LTFAVNSHAKIITLSNCGENNDVLKKDEMDKRKYIKKEYIIDRDKKTVKYNEILTDSEFEKKKKLIVNAGKISSHDFQIQYSDGKFIKAIRKSIQVEGFRWIVEINLNEKTVLYTTELKFTDGMESIRSYIYCGGGGGSKDFLNKIIGK
jgi:hypothetical protein